MASYQRYVIYQLTCPEQTVNHIASAVARVMIACGIISRCFLCGPVSTRLDLDKVLERFPEYGTLIRRLVLQDRTFRELCEDYLAACSSLAWFQSAEEARPEVAEFELLIQQLEEEISSALERARQ